MQTEINLYVTFSKVIKRHFLTYCLGLLPLGKQDITPSLYSKIYNLRSLQKNLKNSTVNPLLPVFFPYFILLGEFRFLWYYPRGNLKSLYRASKSERDSIYLWGFDLKSICLVQKIICINRCIFTFKIFLHVKCVVRFWRCNTILQTG